ncbi:glycosyltransferase family 2 protein [Prevotella sp. OH937_COT-195]|uniref:glycosyltransferase family 2 protein n=1 Tax=Prevotella sp. OH937_COT-195 TaxID=2491051 RepID=UPI000F64A118|nr:glycosyltransferase family 2 protein [Prevotella sp. OH937_COT-195]RRD02776.1 glycosyltransferase family 2 protein [Prevotella sp. OH937_COT-195]
MNDYGLVSIITPTWECGKFIEDMIKSVLVQTYGNWELLVQDDCSTDDTKNIVKCYADADGRIKYDTNERKLGAAATRNKALCRARGKWVAFLDADDLWLPEKLEHQLRFMVEQKRDFSYHEYTEISEEGEETGVYVSGIDRVGRMAMLACCWPGCLTVMYDMEKIGIIQIKNVSRNNDTAIWLKVVRKSPCYMLRENLACYRRRRASITPTSIIKRIWSHYPLFRISEGMNPLFSSFWTLVNVFGNSFKKMFYVKRYNVRVNKKV